MVMVETRGKIVRPAMRGFLLLCAVSIMNAVGCAGVSDPYGYGRPYNPPPPYYGGGPYYGGPGEFSGTGPIRRERRELEQEREKLYQERRRLERERQLQTSQPPTPARPSVVPERCPAGFRASERKCTPQERKKGCRDMRLPGGLGCVSRR